jgi:hypothetical protein
MARVILSALEVEQMATALANQGMHPSRIRARLREHGISWTYQYTHGTGRQERARNLKRLRQQGKQPCQGPECLNIVALDASLCPSCLEAKWRE